ncbi:hypothetical protein FOG18_13240 [Legionella israelensis]|uniref:flagellar motor switch protein FliG n=1 Tax=Legionella israelensis TaxID=454 RepID=UPI001180A28B|nr:FliG C-terminal domain-containing protein [Legionella israelensis]QDP73459.1 hypothetical protein FOG18_13240 [Legionella israelensis]
MSTLKNAAIILLGMGEACAAEILKLLNYKDVEAIIDIMKDMDDVSEEDVIKAVNAFFKETKMLTGLNLSSNTYIRNTLVSAIGNEKAGSLMEENSLKNELKGIELLKWQPLHLIIEILKEEHPQIITVALACLDSDKAAEILAKLPSEISKDVIRRMTQLSPLSQVAMETLSDHLEEQFTQATRFKILVSDALKGAADIISRLDAQTENEIIDYLSQQNKELSEKLQEKLFPFEKLAELDKVSLQILLKEIEQETMVLALKGADEELKQALFQCMSNKSVDLIEEDMEVTGPVKIKDILNAQKSIVEKAKLLAMENKITLPSAKNNTIVN